MLKWNLCVPIQDDLRWFNYILRCSQTLNGPYDLFEAQAAQVFFFALEVSGRK